MFEQVSARVSKRSAFTCSTKGLARWTTGYDKRVFRLKSTCFQNLIRCYILNTSIYDGEARAVLLYCLNCVSVGLNGNGDSKARLL